MTKMRILIGDYETTPFDFDASESYQLRERFVCFKDIESQEKWFFNIEKDGNQPVMDFLNNISGLNRPVRIYFHNLNFDIAFLEKLLRKDCDYDLIKSGSQILQFKVYKQYKAKTKHGKFRPMNKTIIDLRNSLSLFPTKLSILGDSVGLEKLDQDYNAEINEEYIEYCYRDLEIVELALRKLVSDIDELFNYPLEIRQLPLTIASLSKKIFHYLNYEKYGKEIINKMYDINRVNYQHDLRKYYFGGRVEVFDFNQCKDGHYNDINSCFPYEMFRNDFPLAPYTSYKCPSNEQCWKDYKKCKKIFGAICVVKETSDIPLIPIRNEDNKVLFPIGIKKCFLFRKEIDYLIENNQQVKFIRVFLCSEYKPIFKEFIEKTYFERKKHAHDTFPNLLLKLMMNSLYGKFAEKTEKDEFKIINDYKDLPKEEKAIKLEGCEYIDDYDGNGFFLKRTKKENPRLKINIFFSMMITAYARLNLTKYILKSKKPYYCDSDSVVSSNLIENSLELGKMKSEFQFKQFQALSCKEYIYRTLDKDSKLFNVIKMKGFGSINYENFDDFIVEYREGKMQHNPIGFFDALNKRIDKKTVMVFPKFKNGTYDKRWIESDFSTRPFNIQYDDFKDLEQNNELMIKKLINLYRISTGKKTEKIILQKSIIPRIKTLTGNEMILALKLNYKKCFLKDVKDVFKNEMLSIMNLDIRKYNRILKEVYNLTHKIQINHYNEKIYIWIENFEFFIDDKIESYKNRIKTLVKSESKSKKAKETYKESELRFKNIIRKMNDKGYYGFDLSEIRPLMTLLEDDEIVDTLIMNISDMLGNDNDMVEIIERKQYYKQKTLEDQLYDYNLKNE